MGEDFLRKTERSYRRSMQRTVAQRLITPPLLQPTEQNATTYPCRLLHPEHLTGHDGKLFLHRRDDRTIEILDEHRIIGAIDGEASHDLNEYLDTQPNAANILPITPVSNDGTYLDFTIKKEGQEGA
jgi:hypothetical protein